MSKKSNSTPIKIYDYLKKPLPYSSIIDPYNQHALELFEKNDNFINKLTKKEKTRLIYHLYHHYQLELKKLFPIIGLSKTTYYYWLRRFNKPSKDAEIKAKILEIRLEHRNAGYRPMVELLKRENFYVNHKKVQRIMKELGLFSPKYKSESSQFCSYQGLVGKVSKNRLKQRFDTPIAHQKITTDMTEFIYYDRGKKKRLYLVAYLDLFNREIISYGISKHPSYELVRSCLYRALDVTSDCLYRRTFHSDQGWCYQMSHYVKSLKSEKVFQSMNRKGKCHDNSVIENFFGILKCEIYYGRTFTSYAYLESSIIDWIYYYNNKRLKEKLNWMSPVQYRVLHDIN